MGLLVEVMNKSFRKYISSVLPVSRNILKSAVNVVTNRTLDLSDEALRFWKEAYYSLVMLEKILHQFHDLGFERDLEVWKNQFLLSKHITILLHSLLSNGRVIFTSFYYYI